REHGQPGVAPSLHARVDRQPERLHREGLRERDAQLRPDAVGQADRGPRRVPDPEAGLIDLKAARADPDRVRPGIARKGGAEAFDQLLEADERWRALVPQVDELGGRQKVKGRRTPEQVEERKTVKEDLRRLEEELGAAESRRD